MIEEELKAGRLPAVVATSSLELGIDMGAVDLVVQVESPPSVASGLQRVGRAGHQVGAVVARRDLPEVPRRPGADRRRRRADARRRDRGAALPAQPARRARPADRGDGARSTTGTVDELYDAGAPGGAVRRAAALGARVGARHAGRALPERRVRRAAAAAGVGPRHRHADRPPGRAAARGHQRRHHPRPRPVRRVPGRRRRRAGRRVGELDEEMVYESRVGDVFTLGSTAWRIEDITHDRVLVTPAPGPARPAAVLEGRRARPAGRARPGASARSSASSAALTPAKAREPGRSPPGSTTWAADNLLAYLAEQREATGHLPDDRTIVVERFRDELGDWRVVVHSPFGAQVHAPWALAVAARLRERYGVDVQAMHADDGIVLRLPDIEFDGRRRSAADIGADLAVVRRRTRSRRSSPPSSAARRCSRPGSASARRGPCCCPGAPRPAPAAVAAAAAVGPAARGGQRVRLVPDRPRDGARVPAGRLRRARPGRADARHRGARRSRLVEVETAAAVAVRPVAAVRLRRAVPLRGRLAAGRAPRRGARRSTRPCSPSCSASGDGALRDLLDPDAVARTRARAAAAVRRPPGARRRGRRRPAAACSGR